MDYVSHTDDGYGYMAGVELISVGMDWPASTGPYTASFEQLQAIVTAANDDPLVLAPRIKLGHTSEVNGEMSTVDPFAEVGDAAPSFGHIENLRLDGAVLRGDFVDVPVWLADAMPSAYPSRSAEPWLSHTTPSGRHYDAVLSAVSLLGTYWPAITDLDDLQRLMADGPDGPVTATREEQMPNPTPALSVDAGTIAQRFNFQWCFDPESIFEDDSGATHDPYWWWARSVRVDPLEIVAEGDGDELWRIPVTTDGEDNVTFGDPERVCEVYVPVSASAGATQLSRMAPVRDGQRVLASNFDRPEKPARPAASERPSNTNDPEEGTMTPEELALLGLPEDATDDQIEARRAQIAELPADQAGDELDETDDVEHEAEPTVAETDRQPVAASGPVTVDQATLDQLRNDAAAGRAARDQQVSASRTAMLNAAVDEGRIPPARRDHYATLLERDPDGTEVLLTATVENGGLATGLIPVDERGAAPSGEGNEIDVADDGLLQPGLSILTPAERASVAAR